jgi:hypothetical protein
MDFSNEKCPRLLEQLTGKVECDKDSNDYSITGKGKMKGEWISEWITKIF